MIDWDKIDKENEKKYKDYASDGVHKVKVEKMELKELPTGSIAQEFYFAEDDFKYPKATHWLSLKNENWRAYHNRELMILLGSTKENAQKAVEMCEGKGNKDAMVSAYQSAYDRLIAKSPEVQIEVWKDGKYSRSDFNAGVRMSRPSEDETGDVLGGAEEVEISDNDFPF